MGQLARARVFVLSGLRPPAHLDPIPKQLRGAWTFGNPGDHSFQPVDLIDQGRVACTRFAITYPKEFTVAHGQEFALAMQGALALFMRDPFVLSAGAAKPNPSGAVLLDDLIEQMANDFNVDTEVPYLELMDIDGPPDRRTAWLLRAMAPPISDRTLNALRAFDHSVRVRLATFGPLTDDELSSQSASGGTANELAVALVQAYRAIEYHLGGSLPARGSKVKQSLVAAGHNPSTRLSDGVRLDDALAHAEAVRGPSAHGGPSHARPDDLARVQRLARYLLLSALRRLR